MEHRGEQAAERQIAAEVAMLLRLADGNRRSAALEHTLERSAYLVLSVLATAGPANVNTIADHLRLDASTVTRQVAAMESGGLVARRKDPQDGRGTLVEATTHGLDQLADTQRARTAAYAAVLADWDAGDRRSLAAMLYRLNVALDTHAEQQNGRPLA